MLSSDSLGTREHDGVVAIAANPWSPQSGVAESDKPVTCCQARNVHGETDPVGPDLISSFVPLSSGWLPAPS